MVLPPKLAVLRTSRHKTIRMNRIISPFAFQQQNNDTWKLNQTRPGINRHPGMAAAHHSSCDVITKNSVRQPQKIHHLHAGVISLIVALHDFFE